MEKEVAQILADAVSQCDGWYIRMEETQDGWVVWGLHESGARFHSDLYISRGGGKIAEYLRREVQWLKDVTAFTKKHKIRF